MYGPILTWIEPKISISLSQLIKPLVFSNCAMIELSDATNAVKLSTLLIKLILDFSNGYYQLEHNL